MEAIKVTDLDVAYEQKYIIKNMNWCKYSTTSTQRDC